MSYFDEDRPIFNVNKTFQRGTTMMRFAKLCYEFVWRGGAGQPGPGVGISTNLYIRYSHTAAQGIGRGKISSESYSGPSVKAKLGEPLMICFDKTAVSTLKFYVLNRSSTLTYTLSSDEATSETDWRIVLYNGNYATNPDTVELHLRKSKMKIPIPSGFIPWMKESKSFERNLRKKSSLHSLIYIILIVS